MSSSKIYIALVQTKRIFLACHSWMYFKINTSNALVYGETYMYVQFYLLNKL